MWDKLGKYIMLDFAGDHWREFAHCSFIIEAIVLKSTHNFNNVSCGLISLTHFSFPMGHYCDSPCHTYIHYILLTVVRGHSNYELLSVIRWHIFGRVLPVKGMTTFSTVTQLSRKSQNTNDLLSGTERCWTKLSWIGLSLNTR